jgi:SPP1 family phage portal protein
LSTLEDKIYQISAHINSNEKMQSNTSSLALRTRLISLENKCKLNQDAISDSVKNRLRMLFKFLNIKQGVTYDYRDIKAKFTPMIPSDDLITAQILAQAGDRLSTETGIAQFSFIDNPKEELKKIQSERENSLINLDNISGTGDGTT